ncbi:MAG: hypothetical protein U1A78_00540 [Polyangia bacterium]
MSEAKSKLPACGIYRTTRALGEIPADRLVYFHNHGEPGPGIYLPEGWQANRAQFSQRGFTLPQPYEQNARTLSPLPAEGFYRVREAFYCCPKKCRRFEPGLLVQLGYNGAAEPILFTPELQPHGLDLPQSGSSVTPSELNKLERLLVTEPAPRDDSPTFTQTNTKASSSNYKLKV